MIKCTYCKDSGRPPIRTDYSALFGGGQYGCYSMLERCTCIKDPDIQEYAGKMFAQDLAVALYDFFPKPKDHSKAWKGEQEIAKVFKEISGHLGGWCPVRKNQTYITQKNIMERVEGSVENALPLHPMKKAIIGKVESVMKEWSPVLYKMRKPCHE